MLRSWTLMSRLQRQSFGPGTREPKLTKQLKLHIETVTSQELGLIGSWSAENVVGRLDANSLELLEERRTDLTYHWNDATQSIQVVFEFKRMSQSGRHRAEYLGGDGLGRFASGRYSSGEAVAAMVGVLLDPVHDVVPPLRRQLESAETAAALSMRRASTGTFCHDPAPFVGAAFATEHDRTAAGGASPINVSHFFLPFGYPTSTGRSRPRSLSS